jgi:transcriptional regulator with XRE-family HTH domain
MRRLRSYPFHTVCFADFLAQQREAAGLTQGQLAQQVGASRSWVAKLERSSMYSMPPIATLLRIADAIGVPAQDTLDAAGFDWDSATGKMAVLTRYHLEGEECSITVLPPADARLTLAPQQRHIPACLARQTTERRFEQEVLARMTAPATTGPADTERRELHRSCFGSLIRARRRRLGLARSELADRLGLSEIRVGQIERAEFGRLPALDVALRLADVLEVSLADLLDAAGVDRPAFLAGLDRTPLDWGDFGRYRTTIQERHTAACRGGAA